MTYGMIKHPVSGQQYPVTAKEWEQIQANPLMSGFVLVEAFPPTDKLEELPEVQAIGYVGTVNINPAVSAEPDVTQSVEDVQEAKATKNKK